jgi:hypothetical protein
MQGVSNSSDLHVPKAAAMLLDQFAERLPEDYSVHSQVSNQ